MALEIPEELKNSFQEGNTEKEEIIKANELEDDSNDKNKKRKSEATNKLVEFGREVYANKTDEEKNKLGSESRNLELLYFLGAESQTKIKKSKVVSSTGNSESVSYKVPTTVGAFFKSRKDTCIPRIDISITPLTGIDYDKDIKWKNVRANEEFDLNMMEAMIFLTSDEYCGAVSYQGQPDAIKLGFNATKYFRNEQELPTPHFKEKANSGSQSNFITIDIEDPETGLWKIKDEFKERYGKYLETISIERVSRKQSSPSHAALVALGIQKILGVKNTPKEKEEQKNNIK
ncbi:hypothetical protein Q3304_08895 [Clostridioides sp. GD02377]|uniref:hypothetical protein n=1 Tax=unclassified Clostridioides TaxID=2635829 RepID=UPI0038A6909C